MTNQPRIRVLIAVTILALEAWALYTISLSPAHWRPTMIVEDEPEARSLYNIMIQTIQEAQSLSYVSTCIEPDGRSSTYRIQLKKSDHFRVTVTNGPVAKRTTLLGDGTYFWIYWSGERTFWGIDDQTSYAQAKANVFYRKGAPREEISLKKEITRFGMAWVNLIWDPSLFHNNKDPYAPYIDGIRSRGTDTVGEDICDVIEISIMNAQRTRYIWLSRQEHLPRKIKEIVRQRKNHVTVAHWADVTLNPDISPKVFTWSPPETSTQWHIPPAEASLLGIGQPAPVFTLRSIDDTTQCLTDYRGNVVWIYFWQAGSPTCREEMRHLQALYEANKDKGLVLIGINVTDNRRIAQFFLKRNDITFPIVLDSSETAQENISEYFGNRDGNVPLSYIVDKQGDIVEAWYGSENNHNRAIKALKAVGIKHESL